MSVNLKIQPTEEVRIRLTAWNFYAEFSPLAGGNIVAFRHLPSGHDLLRAPDSGEQLFETPECFGMPVLFPPGRIADGTLP